MQSTLISRARPLLDKTDHLAVQSVLDSGAIADGDEIAAFESEFAKAQDCDGGVAVSSGFAALHLCLSAMEIGPGDEVIVPCVSTCPAIRNAVLAVGAVPIYADTNRLDFNLSPRSVSDNRTARTRAIIAPHHTGIPSDVDALSRMDVPVIEDCAQALGATLGNRPLGSIGFASIFSFYATKIMTTVDGGMVLSSSTGFLQCVRDLRYYRGTSDQKLRHNYKMQNLHAALGRTQLAKVPRFIQRRRTIAARYIEMFDALGCPPEAYLHRNPEAIYYRLAVRFPPGFPELLTGELRDRRIPFSREMWFQTDGEMERFPNAGRLVEEIVTFPVYPALTDDDVSVLVGEIRGTLQKLGPRWPDEGN